MATAGRTTASSPTSTRVGPSALREISAAPATAADLVDYYRLPVRSARARAAELVEAGELAPVLAMHFEQAGNQEKAIDYYVAGGQHALAQNAIKVSDSTSSLISEPLIDPRSANDLRMPSRPPGTCATSGGIMRVMTK